MVGGTIFHREVIQREISRVLVLNLLWRKKRCFGTARDIFALTEPSLLSRATRHEPPAGPDYLMRLTTTVSDSPSTFIRQPPLAS
jgi:hypothetical protein